MEPSAVLTLMRAYFEGKEPPELLASFAEQSPRALLKESLDVVDFVVYLEEEIGREIAIQQVGEALMTMNFGQLAEEVARRA